MKKLFSTILALILSSPIAGFAQGTLKIGTVDMQRAFKEYTKTKDAETKINDAKNAAKKEYDDRAEAYKKALDEINNLNKQLDAPALSAEAKTQKAKERDDKIANIKNMEREINDFRQTRERQLQEQAMRMREGIVKEITDVVMEKVKTTNMDLVFDKSGVSLNGVPVLMYSHDNVDFTNDIIAVLNKPGRPTGSLEKTLASPSPAPDNAWRSCFSRSALARSRRIGSQRSARSHLEIFPGFGLSMQPIVSGGQALRRLPERSTLQKHSMTNFSSLEQDGQSASSAPYGSWT